MSFPHLVSFEFYSNDDTLYPSHLSWTLRDTTYKSITIRPDDSWVHQDNLVGLSTDLRTLMELGEDILDIAKELIEDIDDETLYCEDPELAEQVFTSLFDTLNMDVPVTFLPLRDIFDHLDIEQIELLRREVMDELGLAAGDHEENLLVYRAMVARHQQVDQDNHDTEAW